MRTHQGLLAKVSRRPLAVKVPEIGALFWVIKLLTTAGGEATSDFLGQGNVLVGAVVEVGVLALALAWQLRTRRYMAGAYWSLAFAIAIFGTGVSDTLHLELGIPYMGTTIMWLVVLSLVFFLWHRSEGTLSIHSIYTQRRELYYWSVVFATFALGTALGDLTATSLKMGYLASGVMFGVLILVPLAAWRAGANAVVSFWAAYVLTRPLGASFADYVSKGHNLGGLAFGDGHTALVALAAVAIFVGYLLASRRDVQHPVGVQLSRPETP